MHPPTYPDMKFTGFKKLGPDTEQIYNNFNCLTLLIAGNREGGAVSDLPPATLEVYPVESRH